MEVSSNVAIGEVSASAGEWEDGGWGGGDLGDSGWGERYGEWKDGDKQLNISL